jgi:phage replication initiation protein
MSSFVDSIESVTRELYESRSLKHLSELHAQAVRERMASIPPPLHTPPRIVIRGESQSGAAFVDALAFSWPARDVSDDFLEALVQCHFEGATLADTGKGWNGYTRRLDIIQRGEGGKVIRLGLVAYGGEHQRGTVYLSVMGSGTGAIKDMRAFYEELRVLGAVLKRCDITLDDHTGKYSVDVCREWFIDRRFISGGKPPKCNEIGPSTARVVVGDHDAGGRTFEVGKRENGKMLRVYEKGIELGAKHGDEGYCWNRWEVEFRAKDRDLPLEMLINPVPYFLGAYDCLREVYDYVVGGGESLSALRIKTKVREAVITLTKAIEHARLQYGPLINLLMKIYCGDASFVVAILQREGIPRRVALDL